MSHILMERDGMEEQADRIVAAFNEVGSRLQALRPDLIVLVTNDHLTNFSLALQVPFAIGAAEEFIPFGEMDIPKLPLRGHREFAEHFLRYSAEQGFDVAKVEEIRPDHGTVIPNLFVNRDGRIPVVPLYIGTNIDQPPSIERIWRLGRTLRQFVEQARPPTERVVVLSTGGLSHFLGEPEHGRINEAFDTELIDKIVTGRGHEFIGTPTSDIAKQAGRSGLECINWLFMAGCLEGARGEKIFYESAPKWITGMGAIAMTPP
jgi:2'-aminobiphenyl-2,3-diol 1,2-dioxygenase, large subunit